MGIRSHIAIHVSIICHIIQNPTKQYISASLLYFDLLYDSYLVIYFKIYELINVKLHACHHPLLYRFSRLLPCLRCQSKRQTRKNSALSYLQQIFYKYTVTSGEKALCILKIPLCFGKMSSIIRHTITSLSRTKSVFSMLRRCILTEQ